MERSLYFYLEPYVYLKNSKKGLLLINLLDDKAFTFEDSKSIKIGKQLLSSHKRTIQITKDDTQIPIIDSAIRYFMGDTLTAISQPLQFDSEINNVFGKDAYRKSIIYSNYNIGRYLTNCTIFADMANQDCYDYIKLITGIEESYNKGYCDIPSNMNENDIDAYIQELVAINPDIILNICGLNSALLDYILSHFPNVSINPIVSLRALQLNPNMRNLIKEKQLRYTLLLDLSHDNYAWDVNDKLCSVSVKIENNRNLHIANKLIEQGHQINICPVLNSTNSDFIKSLLSISREELLNIKNKYRTLKINNLINSNFWGKLYLFPTGKVCYSLNNIQLLEFNLLYERYKTDFLNGTFEWTLFRNFTKCRDCMFQYLCPAPNYIEINLRENNQIECLISNEEVST